MCAGQEPGVLDTCILFLGGRSCGLAASVCQALSCSKDPPGADPLFHNHPYASTKLLPASKTLQVPFCSQIHPCIHQAPQSNACCLLDQRHRASAHMMPICANIPVQNCRYIPLKIYDHKYAWLAGNRGRTEGNEREASAGIHGGAGVWTPGPCRLVLCKHGRCAEHPSPCALLLCVA